MLIKIYNPEDPEDFRVLDWSTISDSPRSYGLTLAEIPDYRRLREARLALRQLKTNLADDLRRLRDWGTTSWNQDRGADIANNRAGTDEVHLSESALWQALVVERPDEEDNREAVASFLLDLFDAFSRGVELAADDKELMLRLAERVTQPAEGQS